MSTTTIDVDNVATDADLVDELGDETILRQLLPKDSGSSYPFRLRALERTMKMLRRRIPPVVEADLLDVTELRDAVVYGALRRLYERAMTEGSSESLWTKKAAMYREWEDGEIRGVQPTVGDEGRSQAGSLVISRR